MTPRRAPSATALALLAPALLSAAARADDPQLYRLIGAGLGSTRLAFDEKLDADVSFPTYQLFGSIGYGRAYASLTWADSLADENVSEEDEIGEASRQDLDLTIGYRMSEAWTLFLGYKDGETELDLRVRDTRLRQHEYYREDGLYGGVTYSVDLRRAGTLNFSLAYVRFDSDLKFTEGADEDDDDDAAEALEFDDLEGRASGTSDGFSAGISWVMPLAEDLAFRLQYKVNEYHLDVSSGGLTFEPDQRLSYFDAALMYAF